ncbi:protein kinase [Massilia violaceinigra]|uniref:non-specific serine/threonine protein kinase n=1 Tax=Massilia violaceinigra TaxID=2045208 RepID=A0ABY4A2Z2_9BURK|nr:serine/threonine-protein kinase [Massilia violaceinigra]UOD29135.1 protein kinase [Massilia violaceinigra]
MTALTDIEKACHTDILASTPRLPSHYDIRRPLGEGGFGVVYEAWDSKLRRSVAIKFTRHSAPGASDSSLMREARMAASLHHAAFVKVHAIEDTGGAPGIVMELVRGRTLKEVVGDGAPEVAVACDWLTQLADAMCEAHASGLVHGDLKPSNLMIEPGGRLRILDFGLARLQDALSTTSLQQDSLQGTIAYMAPERLMGAAPDARGDIYALGVIFYELLCGARPFADLNGMALAAAQIQSDPRGWPFTSGLAPPLRELICDMTARQPAQRLPDMAQVRVRLGQLGNAAPAAPEAAPWPPPRVRPRPRPAWTWAGAAVLAVAALAGAALRYAGPAQVAVEAALAPYSEAGELKLGLAELKLHDRPGSLESGSARFNRVLAHRADNASAAAGLSLGYSLRYMADTQDENWLQKAAASAQQALKLNNQLALSHTAMSWVFLNQGRHDLAQDAIDAALRLDPGDFFAWYGKVQILRHARRFDQAVGALALARQRFPTERVFEDELGTVHYARGEYAEAEQAFRRSIALEPDAVASYAGLNASLLRQQRTDEAFAVLQQGLQVRPSAKLYGNLGNALFLVGDYTGAAGAFEHAVSPTRGAPGNYLNWANLADALLWIPGREAEARASYAKARALLAPQLQRAPDNATLVYRMGMYCARTGDEAQAIALMTRALELAPASADVRFYAGLAFELIGQRRLALQAIVKARQLGYPARFIEAEPDLIALRRDPAYQAD